MSDDLGIQRQPKQPFNDGRSSDGAGPERFRREQAAPSYGWLLVLVLAVGGGVIGLVTCAGLGAMWLFLAGGAPAPPPPARAGVAPAAVQAAPNQPAPAERNDRK